MKLVSKTMNTKEEKIKSNLYDILRLMEIAMLEKL